MITRVQEGFAYIRERAAEGWKQTSPSWHRWGPRSSPARPQESVPQCVETDIVEDPGAPLSDRSFLDWNNGLRSNVIRNWQTRRGQRKLDSRTVYSGGCRHHQSHSICSTKVIRVAETRRKVSKWSEKTVGCRWNYSTKQSPLVKASLVSSIQKPIYQRSRCPS